MTTDSPLPGSGPGQGLNATVASPRRPSTLADLHAMSHQECLATIEQSPFFDLDWYCRNNPDVVSAGMRPAEHFLLFGAKEWRSPSLLFSTAWYALAYADVANAEAINPLIHFIMLGELADRLPAIPALPIQSTDEDVFALIRASGYFDEAWYLRMADDLAESGISPIRHYLRWGADEGRNPSRHFHTNTYKSYPDCAGSDMNPLLHYILFGVEAGLNPNKPITIDLTIHSMVSESAFFDERYYLENNPDVERSAVDACEHFCEIGYRELRKPSPIFDTAWYQQTYLDGRHNINPLVHFETEGRHAGYLTRPLIENFNLVSDGMHYDGDKKSTLRRACLFAGFDPHGLVDEYVVAYIKELARFADVFYLADNDMQPGELEKLTPYVCGAWALHHGCYDFGSYRKLATELVGWDTLDAYDELMFVNDSAYCIRPLDHVFEKMDSASCDWWGLQATKGIWATRHVPSNRFMHKISISTVRSELLNDFERDYTYDFLIASYFLVFRKPVLSSFDFRRLIESIGKESSKQLIVQKYEIGLTRLLIQGRHVFDTFIDDLYPLHPVYSLTHFTLIQQGFPLLKRFLLTENHYKAVGLVRWKDLVLAATPTANIAQIQANLDRVANQEKLFHNLNLYIDDQGKPVAPPLLSDAEFTALDAITPKRDDWWVFPVCAFNHTLAGNDRAVFEVVRDIPAIKKIILYRSKRIALDGVNVEHALLKSREGQAFLLHSRVMFIKHTPTSNLVYPLVDGLHYLINLWHGIPLKRIGFASRDQQNNLERLGREHSQCKAVIASSKVDRMAMASAFYPLQYNDIWVTGLPRNDFIVREYEALPEDLQQEFERLKTRLAGRRLVLYAPTFRNAQKDGYYRFNQSELATLARLLDQHGAVLGIREHLADTTHSYSSQLSSIGAIPLGDGLYANIEILYRQTDVLLTDYSSCFFDYALTGRPIVSFAYDRAQYEGKERGFFYHMDDVFPGPICESFDQVIAALDSALSGKDARHENYEQIVRMFFDYIDDQNSSRLVKNLLNLLGNQEFSAN